MRIAIIGGGIAGLAAGYRLLLAGEKPVVFEKGDGDRTGSDRVDGFVIDRGAYTIPHTHHAFLALVRDLGLAGHLVETPGTASTFADGEEHRIKIGSPKDFLEYRLLRLKDKTDLARLFLYARSLGRHLNLDEPTPTTLELERENARDYLLEHYSRDILAKIADPIFADLFLGTPEENSKAAFLAVLPNLLRFRIFALDRGMGMVTDALRQRLDVRYHTPVLRVQKSGGSRYDIETGGGNPGHGVFDKIIFALPLPLIPDVLADVPESIARSLKNVRYTPCMVVAAALSKPFDEGAFMNTFVRSQSPTLATVVQDRGKGEGRIPAGKGLATAILTRAASARLFGRSDTEAVQAVLGEMDGAWPGISREVLFARVYRWPFGGVQLPPGTLARQPAMRGALGTLDPNWAFAGDGLYRASMEKSLKTGYAAAERVLGHG